MLRNGSAERIVTEVDGEAMCAGWLLSAACAQPLHLEVHLAALLGAAGPRRNSVY